VNPLLISLLGVTLAPLFIASWRASLLGLACQGTLMALLLCRLPHALESATDWITLLDLAVLRGGLAPLGLYAVLRMRNVRARNDVIPPNLISWLLAIAMVAMSFSFAAKLVAAPGEQQTLVAVSCAGLLLGLFVLSTRSDPLSQIIGALRVENAIALFELGGERHGSAVFVQIGLLVVYGVTVALLGGHLSTLSVEAGAFFAGGSEAEGPTL
jgi:hydrogenase-4 membrane subunit HyfE